MKINLKPNTRRRLHGSAMLVSLMIMGVTTFGVAGWLTLINSRRAYTDSSEYGMRRRVVLENSRQITEEYMYAMVSSADSGSAASFPENPGTTPNPSFDPVEQPDTVEQVVIGDWNDGPFRALGNTGRVNRVGPSNGGGFARKYVVALGKGNNQIARDFEMRSRSPILAGDLVTIGRPTITPWSPGDDELLFGGNIQVDGRTVLWYPTAFEDVASSRYRSNELVLMSSAYGSRTLTDPAGNVVRASNFPATPFTTGASSSSAYGFDGKLSVVKNDYNTLNSLHGRLSTPITANGDDVSSERGVLSNGGGVITIDLNDPALDEVYIYNDTSKIKLVGQTTDSEFAAADGLQPVRIVVVQDASTTRNLSWIELEHRNNRRLVVGVKTTIASGGNANYLNVNFRWMNSAEDPTTGFPTWRLICLGENTDILWTHDYPPSATTPAPPPPLRQVTVFGGVMTDQQFLASNDANLKCFVKREMNPLGLEALLPRTTWLEVYPNNP